MSESPLIKKAREGTARFYLQFGGQGTPWLRELARYYTDPAFGKFFDTAFNALEEERPRVEGTIGLPQGLELKAWLEDAGTIPSEEYLSYAAVSLPLIQLTQMAHLEHLYIKGVSRRELLSWSLGATGHSQGIITAVFTCLKAKDDAYYEALDLFTKYQLYLGVSAQKAHPYLSATAEELSASQALGVDMPSPMAAVLGSDHASIEKLVEEINTDLPSERKIYVSLYNSPTNRILSSYRSSLIAFHNRCRQMIDEKQFKFIYLATTCPFHCPLMKAISPIMEAEIRHINFKYSGEDIQVPVHSFYDQANYQKLDTKLPIRMYTDLMIHPLYWKKAMQPVVDHSQITHVLDFGPGKTSQRLSKDTLKGLGSEKEVLGLAKDLKALIA